MLDITGLIPLVWRSLVNILPDINGFPLLGVKWVSVRHGWISFYRSLSFWQRPRWGADMAVWLRSDTVKHVITVWWVLWQYDISCCWWIGTVCDCTMANEFVSNSSVTVCSHAPDIYDRYNLSGKSIQMSIHGNDLVLTWHPFTGFLTAQSTWIHQWSMCLIIIIICKDVSMMRMSVWFGNCIVHKDKILSRISCYKSQTFWILDI